VVVCLNVQAHDGDYDYDHDHDHVQVDARRERGPEQDAAATRPVFGVGSPS